MGYQGSWHCVPSTYRQYRHNILCWSEATILDSFLKFTDILEYHSTIYPLTTLPPRDDLALVCGKGHGLSSLRMVHVTANAYR